MSRQAGVTPEILQAEYNKFEQAYTKATAAFGATKWDRLNDFRNKAFAALQQDVQRQVAQARQQEVAAERQRAQQAEQQRQQARLPPWAFPMLNVARKEATLGNFCSLHSVTRLAIVIKLCFDTSSGSESNIRLVTPHAVPCMQSEGSLSARKQSACMKHVASACMWHSQGKQQRRMQVEARAADLGQQVQRLQAEVDRLNSELSRERSSKEQHTSRVSLLEKQLQDKSASLVTTLYNV